MEQKEKLKNLLMWGEFFFHIMVDHEIIAYVKNKRRLARCLQDVFARLLCKTSLRCLQDVLEDVKLLRWSVLKSSSRHVLKTSLRPTNICWGIWDNIRLDFPNEFTLQYHCHFHNWCFNTFRRNQMCKLWESSCL